MGELPSKVKDRDYKLWETTKSKNALYTYGNRIKNRITRFTFAKDSNCYYWTQTFILIVSFSPPIWHLWSPHISLDVALLSKDHLRVQIWWVQVFDPLCQPLVTVQCCQFVWNLTKCRKHGSNWVICNTYFWENNLSHNNITKQCRFPCFYSKVFANENGFAGDLKHWDIPFWSQKHKEHMFRLRNKFLNDFPLIISCTMILLI